MIAFIIIASGILAGLVAAGMIKVAEEVPEE